MALAEDDVKAAYRARCDPRQMERFDFLGWAVRVRVGTWPAWEILAWSVQQAGIPLRSQVWSYTCRKIEGSDTWSMHSYGLALDLNAPSNGRGLPRERSEMQHVARFLEEHERNVGFVILRWGGYWEYTDPMHFQVACSPSQMQALGGLLKRPTRILRLGS